MNQNLFFLIHKFLGSFGFDIFYLIWTWVQIPQTPTFASVAKWLKALDS